MYISYITLNCLIFFRFLNCYQCRYISFCVLSPWNTSDKFTKNATHLNPKMVWRAFLSQDIGSVLIFKKFKQNLKVMPKCTKKKQLCATPPMSKHTVSLPNKHLYVFPQKQNICKKIKVYTYIWVFFSFLSDLSNLRKYVISSTSWT